MATIRMGEGNHRWDKKNLVTAKGGYDTHVCTECGIEARVYRLGEYTSDKLTEEQLRFCSKVPRLIVKEITITNLETADPRWSNLKKGSTHKVVEPPKGENENKGFWVMGVGEPVIVFFRECEFKECKEIESIIDNQEPAITVPQNKNEMKTDKTSVLIAGILFSAGAQIVVTTEPVINAVVTRVTDKAIFILKDGETEPKMIVSKLVASYLEKKLWNVTPVEGVVAETSSAKAPVATKEEKEAAKAEKAATKAAEKLAKDAAKEPAVPKLRKFSPSLIIHYCVEKGLTAAQIRATYPDIAKSHIASSFAEATKDAEWRKRSVDTYLAWNAINPVLAPLDIVIVEPAPKEEKALKAEKAKKEIPAEVAPAVDESITIEVAPAAEVEPVVEAATVAEPAKEEESF